MTATALGIVGLWLGYVAASGRWQQPAPALGADDVTYLDGAGPVTTRPAVDLGRAA